MTESIFQNQIFLDFHTHKTRHIDREDVMEIISLDLGQEREKKYFTVGLHPWWADKVVTAEQKDTFSILLSDPSCLAMGEVGLDKLKGPSISEQMDVLRSQLEIAQSMKKPVIIHCVRAFDQLIKIKKEFPSIRKWCVHGYGRHTILAKQLIDQGFYLSLMPNITAKYKALFESLPSDKLFLETDSMADINILDIYQKISALTGISMTDLCTQMNSNARDFFER
jgi:TatD DNase family protein